MKFTKVLVPLMLLLSFAVSATILPPPPPPAFDPFGISPQVPNIYKDGLLRVQLPNTTPSERAAFSLYEAALQASEAIVQTRGCVSTNVLIDAYTDVNGTGDLSFNGQKLFVTRVGNDTFRGDKYRVTGASASVPTVPVKGIIGNYSYNLKGTIMEGDWVANVYNPTAPTIPDVFTGKVIKDFFLYNMNVSGEMRDVVLDWGLQVIDKKGYPASKYWQRSRTIREDGVEGETIFQKTRIAGGPVCTITISTHGNNNPDFFYQTGYLTIRPGAPITPRLKALQ